MLRKLGVTTLQVLWVLFLTFLLLEGASRWMLPKSERMAHPILNHVWRPNQVMKLGDCAIPINRQGWIVDHDIAREKPEKRFRLFILGDSFTAQTCPTGVGPIIEKTLTPLFRQRGLELEVINTATPSYSPELYRLLIEHYVLPYSPDLVLLNIDMTDAFDDYLARQISVRDQTGKIIAVPRESVFQERFRRTAEGLVSASLLYRTLIKLSRWSDFLQRALWIWELRMYDKPNPGDVRAAREASSVHGTFFWCRESRTSEEEQNLQLTFQTITEIAALVRRSGGKMFLSAVPHLEQFTGTYSLRPFEEIRSLSEKIGVPYIDSYGELKKVIGANDPAKFYLSHDMHFDARGLEAWGNIEAKFLAEHLALHPKSFGELRPR